MRRANVLGLGLIGGSLALALTKCGFYVTGSDENLQTAMQEQHIPFAAQNRFLAKLAPMDRGVLQK